MQTLNGHPVDYAGDGIYVVVDWIGVWLHANHHENPTDKVYLEDKVLESVIKIREMGRVQIANAQELKNQHKLEQKG